MNEFTIILNKDDFKIDVPYHYLYNPIISQQGIGYKCFLRGYTRNISTDYINVYYGINGSVLLDNYDIEDWESYFQGEEVTLWEKDFKVGDKITFKKVQQNA